MKVLFRADANSNIGQGHVMRCLSIADALTEAGHFCIFASADETASLIITQRRFDCKILGTDYSDPESETEAIRKVIDEIKPDVIIVDGYYVNQNYLLMLRGFAPTVYMDDVYTFAYETDMLINYNVYASLEKYEKLYEKEGVKLPKLLLGPKYVPLRKEFTIRKEKTIPEKAKKIMISVGGADPLHLALAFLEEIISDDVLYCEYSFNFILGRMEPDIDIIKQKASDRANVKVNVNVLNMKDMIEDADLVISAAGSTQYEICACKTPCISFSMADNQVEGCLKFDEIGAFVSAGDVRNNTDFVKDLFSKMVSLSKDRDKREKMSAVSGELADGLGASRIAGELEKLVKAPVDRR
ncbi:MAG: UDP-2,4-diacetamido-2,4,6-trideoxy-beta-L-altropyranose hydrolase [Lachnospiraceae bacterium]|nr:UDP-2,4-diacetamido-2,4,6-trideoxy-beta-L-altropyranose hydrolase [Lachnospiraceae bacterium]